jgi:hypothetical protein
MSKYLKAVWAFASTIVGALIVAVSATPNHSLRDVGTLGYLTLAATVLAVTGGVYGFTNASAAPPPPAA